MESTYCKLFILIVELVFVLQVFNCFELNILQKCHDPLEDEYGKLLHSAVIFRHGDRAPQGTYPTDPYQNHSWGVPWEGLLDKGKKRAYELGKMLRKRYDCLVPPNYDTNSILVQSSDFDRSIMTAQCFLYGFYQNSDSHLWNDGDTKWSPVPIHTIPEKYDQLIYFTGTRLCPGFIRLYKAADRDERMQKLFAYNFQIFRAIEKAANISLIEEPTVFDRIEKMSVNIRDALKVQEENNLPLPMGTGMPPHSLMLNLVISSHIILLSSSNNEMAKFFVTPMLKSIVSDMIKVTNSSAGDKFEQKLHIYSGHDLTIDYNTYFFNEFYPLSEYASNLLFELRELTNGSKIVTVSKMNNTDSGKWFLLKTPNCGYGCPLEKFTKWIDEITIDNWQNTCDTP